MNGQLGRATLELAALRIRERNQREIERAIDRIKESRSAFDGWFRRQWYRAGWQGSRRSRAAQHIEQRPPMRRWS